MYLSYRPLFEDTIMRRCERQGNVKVGFKILIRTQNDTIIYIYCTNIQYIYRNIYIDSLDIFVMLVFPFLFYCYLVLFSAIFTDLLMKKLNYLSYKCFYLPVTFCSVFSIQ